MTLKDFRINRGMRAFVPVATWDSDDLSTKRESEYVSMIEGKYHPYFGFAYRIDKVQFDMHSPVGDRRSKVDHHKKSIQHAQRIANLIVDEARLSPNRYKWTNDETDRLIKHHDTEILELPAHVSVADLEETYRSEMYLF